MNYKEVIESRYNRQNWQQLLHDIFGNKIKFWNTPSAVPTSSPFAKQALWLGTITLSDEQTIAVYEVELSESVDIERNRRGIRDMLLTAWRNNGNAGAFMFCYRKNESVLRFSYVSESWKFADDGSYQKESTDTRRFTYLLGEGHRSRTAIQQFEKLRDSQLSLKDLTKAFSVDAVSDMFFDGYKKQYENIIFYITGKRMVKVANKWEERLEGQPCQYIMRQFARAVGGDLQSPTTEKAVRDYVKKLMGRLVFLQFLQKKGWLGVSAHDEWGNGDPEFIQNLFARCNDKDHFIDNVLEPLFNDLNTEEGKKLPQYRTPYLNGGLFEREAADETDFPLPAQYMQSLLDFFASYNFTIDENDPDDAEVGVDPEMLGRIFENLLEDNKDKGAFYTPKEIVSYMCRESLIAYLQTGIEDEPTKEAIRQFVTTHQIQEHLPENTDQLLKDVKICDPAIGSGAFPMGLLKELFLCRTTLEGISQHQAAEIKKHIIQQNVYDVDIERGAVDIARLRFWLSLIVDEETPQALPNLDFKIMQGNSLLEQYKGVDLSRVTKTQEAANGFSQQSFDGDLFANVELPEMLRNMLSEYYECTDHQEKQSLRERIINNVRQQLQEQHINVDFGDLDLSGNNQFFLWHTWFHDVFSKGGFDIVIGNPPYGAKLSSEEKKYCKRTYRVTQNNNNLKGSSDTFCVFIECGFLELKQQGVLSYIVPMSVTSSDAMEQLHELLYQGCESLHISSYSNRPKQIFDSAGLRVSIVLFRRTDTSMRQLFTTKLVRRRSSDSLTDILDNLKFVNTVSYRMPGRYAKVGSEIEIRILDKLFSVNNRLADYEQATGKPIFYRAAGGRYFNVVTDYTTNTSAEKIINVVFTKQVGLCLSSTVFWFYQQVYTDGLNLKTTEIKSFPLPDFRVLSKKKLDEMAELYQAYLADIEQKANIRQSSGNSSYNVDVFKEYKIVRSMGMVNKIDSLVCPLYNFNKEETEYIMNYEMELRRSGE